MAENQMLGAESKLEDDPFKPFNSERGIVLSFLSPIPSLSSLPFLASSLVSTGFVLFAC
jgi:hypothetical protein